MTESEFKRGIRDALCAAFMDGENRVADLFATVRDEGGGALFIEGEINLDALADAVHEFVVEALSPPFGVA